MVIQILGVIVAIVVAVGVITALMVWKRKVNYRAFFIVGNVVVATSIVLMVICFVLQILFLICIPILVLGLIYLIIGLVNRDKRKKIL